MASRPLAVDLQRLEDLIRRFPDPRQGILIDLHTLDVDDWYAVVVDDQTLYKSPDAERLIEAFHEIGANMLYRVDVSEPVRPPHSPTTLRFPADVDAMYEEGVGYTDHFFVLSQVITDEQVRALSLSNWDDYRICCGPRRFVEKATGATLPMVGGRVFRIGSAFYAKDVVEYYRLLEKPDVDHPDF